MANYKSLLIKWQIVDAGKLRKCYHSKKHKILKGDRTLEVAVGMGMQGYCLECGRQMLDAAAAELEELRGQLGAP